MIILFCRHVWLELQKETHSFLNSLSGSPSGFSYTSECCSMSVSCSVLDEKLHAATE